MLKWGGGWRAATCQPTPNLNLEYDYVKVGGEAGRPPPAGQPPTHLCVVAWQHAAHPGMAR
jgi:hypothetical protein